MWNWTLILQIFVLLTPLSSVPFLMAAHRTGINVRRLAISAVITAFAIAAAIVLVGPVLFDLFGVSMGAFRIAGGVVLLLLGLETIRDTPKEMPGQVSTLDGYTAIIATPLLTGPVTMTFVTVKTAELGVAAMLANLAVGFAMVGLFLTAVAIEMAGKGLTDMNRQVQAGNGSHAIFNLDDPPHVHA